MSNYRTNLPQLGNKIFLTDSGLETTLIFHDGLDLPHFAAIDALRDSDRRSRVEAYYTRHIAIATSRGIGFILESPTWRASPDWGRRLGLDHADLAAANRDAIAMMAALRRRHDSPKTPMVVSGNVGPRGDGYQVGELMNPTEAECYHAWQVDLFADTEADMVCGATITNSNEAIGIVRAAKSAGMPVAISFTVETDGRLPSGESLGEAIEAVDAATSSAAAYFMLNCAHPTHFASTLAAGGAWLDRIRGIRANASTRSHDELNEAPDLDDGDPVRLGEEYSELRQRHRRITVLGGCCGTDHRHIERICDACLEAA